MNNEAKQKISSSLKGRSKTDVHKDHISMAMKNHLVTDKTKEKISQSLKAYFKNKQAVSSN